MQQKQGVIMCPSIGTGPNEVFEDIKTAFDTVLPRHRGFATDLSQARARSLIEEGLLSAHGEWISFRRKDGGTASYCVIPVTINLK